MKKNFKFKRKGVKETTAYTSKNSLREMEEIGFQKRFDLLSTLNPSKGLVGNAGRTASTLGHSAFDFLSRDGNLKRAGIGTLQSAGVSAVGHGGVAALSGDDPWEAAKTGALRGAMVGGGYQGLKAANQIEGKGNFLKNTGKILKGTAGTFSAHTAKGAEHMMDKGMSRQVKKIIEANNQARLSTGLIRGTPHKSV